MNRSSDRPGTAAPLPKRHSAPVLTGLWLAATLAGTGCVVERTVRDSHGNVILQGTDLTSPFESEAEKFEEVREAEAAHGYGW